MEICAIEEKNVAIKIKIIIYLKCHSRICYFNIKIEKLSFKLDLCKELHDVSITNLS